jgi:hypothetical protein
VLTQLLQEKLYFPHMLWTIVDDVCLRARTGQRSV